MESVFGEGVKHEVGVIDIVGSTACSPLVRMPVSSSATFYSHYSEILTISMAGQKR